MTINFHVSFCVVGPIIRHALIYLFILFSSSGDKERIVLVYYLYYILISEFYKIHFRFVFFFFKTFRFFLFHKRLI